MKRNAVIVATAAAVMAMAGVAGAGTLKLMVAGQQNPTLDKIVKEYQKDHKGTKVELIYMNWRDQAEAISKKPDIFFGYDGFISENVDIGIIQDISKLIPASELRNIMPNLLNSYKQGKKLYALPVAASASVLAYNKAKFTKAGLPEPKASWTWEGDFYTACRKLSTNPSGNGVGATYGMVGMPQVDIMPIFNSFGGQVTDSAMKKVLYTQKEGLKAIDFIIKIHKEKVAESVDWSTVNNEDPKTYPFMNGKSAIQITNGSSLDPTPWNKWLKDNKLDFQVGMSVIPSGPKGCTPVAHTNAMALMVTCKNKSEAVSLMKYILSDKGQNMLYDVTKALPTTTPGLSYKPFTKAVPSPFIKAYRNSRVSPIYRNWRHVQGTLWGDVQRIINGEGTMQELLDNAKQRQSDLDSGVY